MGDETEFTADFLDYGKFESILKQKKKNEWKISKFIDNLGEEQENEPGEDEFEEDDDDSVKDPNYVADDGDAEDDTGAACDDELEQQDFGDMNEDDGSFQLNDLNFVKVIESVGKCLLQKSQTPPMKKKKSQALAKVISVCLDKFGASLSEKQAKRKLDNLKSRVKQKIDRKKTGNLPINLNEADQLLLNLLDAEENPSMQQVPC